MTNPIALGLGLVLALALAADAVLFGFAGSVFLARRFLELIRFLAFWR